MATPSSRMRQSSSQRWIRSCRAMKEPCTTGVSSSRKTDRAEFPALALPPSNRNTVVRLMERLTNRWVPVKRGFLFLDAMVVVEEHFGGMTLAGFLDDFPIALLPRNRTLSVPYVSGVRSTRHPIPFLPIRVCAVPWRSPDGNYVAV